MPEQQRGAPIASPHLPSPGAPGLQGVPVTVLLVDDEPWVADAVRSMLAGEDDIQLHYCRNPREAAQTACRLSPAVILLDLVLGDVDGLTLVRLFRAIPALRDVPLLVLSAKEEATVKAQAFLLGANDYLVKLPNKAELLARIRYHARSYFHLVERNAVHAALQESQRELAAELSRAAAYVHSLLPAPIAEGPVLVDWLFHPSSTLGGDSLGYHWVDPSHFAIYLIDASGHGIGSALLSVSALNMIKSQSLPHTDFTSPEAVLASLNDTFQMKNQDNLYFTIWYGVYDLEGRVLRFAGAGHPAPLLCRRDGAPQELLTENLFIGVQPGASYAGGSAEIREGDVLYLFTDGVYEITSPDGSLFGYRGLTGYLSGLPCDAPASLDDLYALGLRLRRSEALEDDFTVLRITFPAPATLPR
jgi:sigma-B regulation protein RsbU (phosphoserine phosphatase)